MIPTIISRTEETLTRRTTVVEYRGDRYVVIDLIDANDGKYIDTIPGVGRNANRQPSEKTCDLRISRTFRIRRSWSLEGIVDVYNVFNWANQYTRQTQYTDNAGVLNPYYGAIDSPDNRTREVQFTLKVRF